MRRFASFPESVSSSSPEELRSSLPTLTHRPGGRLSNTVRRPSGSLRVTSSPTGLWYRSTRILEKLFAFTGLPSTRTASPGLALSPSLATSPFTVTRPAAIQPSISRREPRPAAASNFCSRSAVGASGGLFFLRIFPDRGFRSRRNDFELEGLRDLCQRRQLLQRAQPEIVEELGGRRVQRRATRGLALPDDVDPAACLE